MGKREKECVPYGLAKITENPRNWAKSQKTCHYFVIHSRNIWGFRFVKKNRICLEDKLPCICGGLSLLVCEPFVLSFFFWHTQPGSISSTDKFQTQSVSCYRKDLRQNTTSCFFLLLSMYPLLNAPEKRRLKMPLSPASLGPIYSQEIAHFRKEILSSTLLNSLKQSMDTPKVPTTVFFFRVIVPALMRHPTILRRN